jgi:hypothetical protein
MEGGGRLHLPLWGRFFVLALSKNLLRLLLLLCSLSLLLCASHLVLLIAVRYNSCALCCFTSSLILVVLPCPLFSFLRYSLSVRPAEVLKLHGHQVDIW